MENYTDILQYLYLGSKDEVVDVKNIRLLINCSIDIPFPKNNAVYPTQIRIPVEEDEIDSIKLLEMIIYSRTIEKMYECLCNKQIVYIFCSGIQRSCAIISCFLIKYMKMDPVYAIYYVCKKIKMSEHDYIFTNTTQYYYHYLHLCKEKKEKKEKKIEKQKIDEKKKVYRIGPRILPI